jgi:hypothetical protein
MDKYSSEGVDFSGDDFANDPEISKARREAKEYSLMVRRSLDIIQDALGVHTSNYVNLDDFSMFHELNAFVKESYTSTGSSLPVTVSIVEYFSSYPVPRDDNSGSDHYLFGYIGLKKKFPKTYICKERIPEKIVDLITRMETDFPEHKKFSRKFHVLTQDEESLTEYFRFKDLGQLAAYPDMELEIHENGCLFRHSRCAISVKEAERFSALARSLIEIFE